MGVPRALPVYVYVCVCVCVCACVRACKRTSVGEVVYGHVDIGMQGRVCVCVSMGMCMLVRMSVNMCENVCQGLGM